MNMNQNKVQPYHISWAEQNFKLHSEKFMIILTYVLVNINNKDYEQQQTSG